MGQVFNPAREQVVDGGGSTLVANTVTAVALASPAHRLSITAIGDSRVKIAIGLGSAPGDPTGPFTEDATGYAMTLGAGTPVDFVVDPGTQKITHFKVISNGTPDIIWTATHG